MLIAHEDSACRRMLAQATVQSQLGRVEVTAATGLLALEKLENRPVDVILLSLHLPEEEPLSTMGIITTKYPHLSVVVVSDEVRQNVAHIGKAEQVGYIDLLLIDPHYSFDDNVKKLESRLKGLFTLVMTTRYTGTVHDPLPGPGAGRSCKQELAPRHPLPTNSPLLHAFASGADLIVIASSTGGPAALRAVFSELSPEIIKPILVVQHMPVEYTAKLAHSLDKNCPLTVRELTEDTPLQPGLALLAQGGRHMVITHKSSGRVASLDNGPPVQGVKPSADILFRSVAAHYRYKKILAVVLTGMGSDGLSGVRELKQNCHCLCLVQSEKTCVVYGMPGNIARAGLADEILDLKLIGARINALAIAKKQVTFKRVP